MVRTWIPAIYDRTFGDVKSVQLNPDQTEPIGVYNAVDLNRIEQNTAYCIEYMLEHKIYRTPPEITVRESNYWQPNMIPSKQEMDRIIGNVVEITEYAREKNLAIANDLPVIYRATQINYVLANAIEKALDVLHNQPDLPLDYFVLRIENGIIIQIQRADHSIEEIMSNEAYIAEDEIATIRGIEYGEYAQYQHFMEWSGDQNDLQYLGNYLSKETTYLGQYRDVTFTANFRTRIPRTLSLTSGYISVTGSDRAESGPNSGTYYAGDNVMIIANRAASGKAFYEWLGTEDALENLVGASETDPSTCWLQMPDCDVNLYPRYINAGQHEVTVTNGTGGGWYDYNEWVSISANDRGRKYQFSNWSGDTSYLEDIHSSSTSFKMGDVNISFRANYSYVYSYNSVTVIGGTIDGNSVGNNLRESSGHTIVANVPAGQGFDYWSLEGVGSFDNNQSANTTFYVGDGNAIITAHFKPVRTLTLENVNNNGGTSSSNKTVGKTATANTIEVVDNYIFNNWTKNGSSVSSSYYYAFTMPDENVTLHANYRERHNVQITINYGNHSETVTMLERNSKSITADAAPSGYHFVRWDDSNIYSINNRYSTSTSITAGSGNGTVTAVYAEDDTRPSHTLTVNYGSGSGTIKEGSSTTIRGNQAPATYEFDYWEINSGNGTIDNINRMETTYRMGTTNGVITAHYKPIPYFTVTVENGYVKNDNNEWVTSASIIRNSSPQIQMKPAPEGKQFFQWEVLQGDNNDVAQPLAETTYIRNLTHNVTVRATYYIPSDSVTYTLTLTRRDGTIELFEAPMGDRVEFYCSEAPEGLRFYRWCGDYQYLMRGAPRQRYYGGTDQNPQQFNMPARSCVLWEDHYVPLDYDTKYHLWMANNSGECCYTTQEPDPEDQTQTISVDHWVTDWQYLEGEEVRIRTKPIPLGREFTSWTAVDGGDQEHDLPPQYHNEVFINPSLESTTLIMTDFDLWATAGTVEIAKKVLTVDDGYESGEQYPGGPMNVYFGKVDTNDIHYAFDRWTGTNIAQIRLYDGSGMFDVTKAGSSNDYQTIAMPNADTRLTPRYTTLYKVNITNGTIENQPQSGPYYAAGTTINIIADAAPLGQKFQRWGGNTAQITNIYDPTTTLTTVAGITTIYAIYSVDADQNNIGYVLTDLTNSNIINNEDITIISGTLGNGFIITDTNGHLYIINSYGTPSSGILRMTTISKGGDVYE